MKTIAINSDSAPRAVGGYSQATLVEGAQRLLAEVQARYSKPEFDVHLIWGTLDTFIPIAQGVELESLLSASSMTIIPDAAHVVPEDAPEAIVAALMRNTSN